MADNRYVLITPARNEEAYIEKTIQAVISQTVPPEKWVIVSDGSTDRTDDIVGGYERRWDFIKLLRVRGDDSRNFGSKVRAINKARELLTGVEYGFIGNLDADISFGPAYYETVLRRFSADGLLGIAGGFLHENEDGEFVSRPFSRTGSVPNAIQLFRRECYEQVGGFIPLRYGGEDWYSEVMARSLGWRVESFRDIKVLHLRRTLAAEGRLGGSYRQGKMDYDLGSSLIFEVFKCIIRATVKPFGLYAGCRFAGFISGYLSKGQRGVSGDFIKKIRSEQYGKIRQVFSNLGNIKP